MRYDLNNRKPERTADELEAQIQNTRKKISEYDEASEAARRLREHDPWKSDRERIRWAALKDVELQRLQNLTEEYQRVRPADRSSWRPAPSGFWHGSSS